MHCLLLCKSIPSFIFAFSLGPLHLGFVIRSSDTVQIISFCDLGGSLELIHLETGLGNCGCEPTAESSGQLTLEQGEESSKVSGGVGYLPLDFQSWLWKLEFPGILSSHELLIAGWPGLFTLSSNRPHPPAAISVSNLDFHVSVE